MDWMYMTAQNSEMTAVRVIACTVILGAACLADQVTLKNGDRITGAIIKKDDKTLTVKSAFLGTVTMPWEQVQAVKADAPLTVVLADGQQIQSTLETVNTVQVTAIRNAAEQAAYERLQHPRLIDLWGGTGTFGIAGTTGNSETQVINGAVSANRETRRDKLSVQFNSIRSTSVVNRVKSQTAQAIRGGVGYDRNLNPKLYFNVFNDYEYDRFQNLDLRATFGGGFGYHAWKAERGYLDAIVGGDYDRARYGASSVAKSFTESSAEIFFGDDFAYKLRTATALTQTFRMYNNLTRTGNYRVNADIGLNTRIMKWLNWNVALSNRYLSNPAPGRKTNDLVYTTGLGITFARR